MTHQIKCEIAFDTPPGSSSPVWTDVTAWLLAHAAHAPRIRRGRQDEFADVQPGTLALTLDNSDGRFTAGRAASPYYPNVKRGRRIRLSAIYAGTTYYRFDGYVDRWPQQWIGSAAKYAEAQLTATDRQARLGRAGMLRSIVEEEYLLDAPHAYYPMGDAEGSVAAGQGAATTQPALSVTQTGSGGTLTFGAGTGPGTDGLTAPVFTPASSSAGKYLSATLSPAIVASAYVVEAFINTTTASRAIATVTTEGGGYQRLEIDATGRVQAVNPTTTVPGPTTNVTDGATHHVAVHCDTATDITTVYVDGVAGTATADTGAPSDLRAINVGANESGTALFAGTMAHAAINTGATAARILAHHQAGATGFAGERSDQRISRIATYAGIPAADQVLEPGLTTAVVAQDTTGQSPSALLQALVQTENGLLFVDTQGRLTFHSRSHRYNQTISYALDGTAGEVGADLLFVEDDFGLANDVTASRPGGITARAVNQASIDEYQRYRADLQLLTSDDNEVASAAQWRVNNYGTPLQRCPQVNVDLLTQPAKIADVAGTDLGARIQLTNLPGQAAAATVDLNIEGYTETIGLDVWDIDINASPASTSTVWALDSATYSVLDSSTRLTY